MKSPVGNCNYSGIKWDKVFFCYKDAQIIFTSTCYLHNFSWRDKTIIICS